MIEPF